MCSRIENQRLTSVRRIACTGCGTRLRAVHRERGKGGREVGSCSVQRHTPEIIAPWARGCQVK